LASFPGPSPCLTSADLFSQIDFPAFVSCVLFCFFPLVLSACRFFWLDYMPFLSCSSFFSHFATFIARLQSSFVDFPPDFFRTQGLLVFNASVDFVASSSSCPGRFFPRKPYIFRSRLMPSPPPNDGSPFMSVGGSCLNIPRYTNV